MSALYTAITDEFKDQLASLAELVSASQEKSLMPRTRVASIRASTLLLAATFEEFIREMALERAHRVVERATTIVDIPDKLLEAAWDKTLEEIQATKIVGDSKQASLALKAKASRPRFDAVCLFVEGDISQDIYSNLTKNKNNMRPDEINRLFRIGGVQNICQEICRKRALQRFFGAGGQVKTYEYLRRSLNNFIDKRNSVAHSPNMMSSDAPEAVLRDIRMLRAVATNMEVTLNSK